VTHVHVRVMLCFSLGLAAEYLSASCNLMQRRVLLTC
jgi:hypothetical protein